jgi:hypothetical protein
MKLQGLILLVLLIVGGTAASVRWYLQAEPRGGMRNIPAQTVARPASSPKSTGLPMRAEPARRAGYEPLSSSWEGVASRDSQPSRLEASPEVAPPACNAAGAVLGAFAPADPL